MHNSKFLGAKFIWHWGQIWPAGQGLETPGVHDTVSGEVWCSCAGQEAGRVPRHENEAYTGRAGEAFQGVDRQRGLSHRLHSTS